MIKKLLLLVVSLSYSVLSIAQQVSGGSNLIRGKILDENNSPIEFAATMLLSLKDSSLIKGEVTDASGNFELENIPPGNYLLSVSSLGFQRVYTPVNSDHSDLNIGNITLKQEDKEISEVTVTAHKPLIQHENDKLILNVEASSIAAGGNVMDVIEKAPGVVVDQDGNISLRGKQGVLVMIDDKPTYLSAEQLAHQLKSMSSEAVSRIEVITNPSSRYDAEGNAGIINIVTKKDKNLGLNGSLTAGAQRSQDWNPSAGINLNYRFKKVNLFGNYNYSNRHRRQTLIVDRHFDMEGVQSTVHEESDIHDNYTDNSYKAGIDYFMNEHHTIGFVASGYFDNYAGNNNTSADIFNSNGFFELPSHTEGILNNPLNNYSFNINYDGKLDTSGTKISGDLDYSHFTSNGDDHYTTIYFNADGSETGNPLLYSTKSPGTIDIKSAKMSFTHSFLNGWNFETGTKTSAVRNDNEEIFSVNTNNEWTLDSTKTNHFVYKENIYAGYLQLGHYFKNISIQAGLRGELTEADGNSITVQQTFRRNYFQLFPSLSINDKINDKNSISFSYSRRIDRPNYDQLNPFLFFLDPYLYEQGNPNLKPQLTHSLELSYLYKETYSLTLNYSHTTDEIQEQFYQTDSSKTIVLLSDNFGSNTTYAATAYAQLQPVKWWSITPVVTAFYQDLKTDYLETDFHNTNFGYNINLQNNFTLPHGFSIELSGQYQSPVIFSIASIEGNGDVSIGLKKSLWNGKATVKLNAKDIFDTNNIAGQIVYANINSSFTQNNDRRRVGITFSYRFGNSQASQREHKNSIDEEQNRVKKGG